MSRLASLLGVSTSEPAGSANTRADLFPPLPANSIHAGRAPFERFDLPEPFRDIGLVLFGSLTTVSAVCILAILLFVRVG